MRSGKHGARLEQALIRYNRALDKSDLEGCYLALRGALEHLTGTERADYNQTVRRAAFVGKRRNYDLMMLQYLRDHRNDIAHKGGVSDWLHRHIAHLKRYVEAVMSFLFEHCREFKDGQDLVAVLDGPTDRGRLKTKKQSLVLATKIMKGSIG